MNILIVGSGGREHAMAWKIAQSPKCDKLFLAPGNAGTAAVAQNLSIGVNDFEAIGKAAIDNNISLIIVGPEEPLVKGFRNYFEKEDTLKHILIVGPDSTGAQLEGSKDFSKAFMVKHGIPAGKSQTFTASTIDEGIAFLQTMSAPYVLKADGLAAGKGVLIEQSLESASQSLRDMLVNEKFGDASAKVLVEEYLHGIELSVFVVTDGTDYAILPEAKDYKRIGEQDTGLNTGGMGAVSPVSFAQGGFLEKVEDRVVKPTLKGLKADGIDYKGFIFIGLMNVNGDPYVIEYNVRMGDPETQVVLPRIKSDFLELMIGCAEGTIAEKNFEVDSEAASTVVMVSGGYPEKYDKGNVISGLSQNGEATVFHAGTKLDSTSEVVTNGGRVLAVTGKDSDLRIALEKSYATIEKITWKDAYFRKDIGQDILNRES